MRKGILIAVLLAWGALTGCGEGEPVGPTVDRSAVAGVYHLAALSFDPQGSLPKTDILGRLAPADRPELSIGRTDDRFRLAFRDPGSGLPELVEGSYTLLNEQVRLSFKKSADARAILLPQRLELDFDRQTMTLSYRANTDVSLARLRELVPEFRNEQLPDPVFGELVVVFDLDRR
jgi:hypothetical protein